MPVQVDAFNEDKLKDELSGGPLTHKADADIFFVDKAPAAAPGPAPVAKVCSPTPRIPFFREMVF